MGYTILRKTKGTSPEGEDEEGVEHPLAPRTGQVIRRVNELGVRSNYFSHERRCQIAHEMGYDEWIKEKREEGDNVIYIMKEADLPAFEFREKVAAVLFPTAPVDDNLDEIDHEVVEEALSDFLSKVRKRSASSSASPDALKRLASLIPENTD